MEEKKVPSVSRPPMPPRPPMAPRPPMPPRPPVIPKTNDEKSKSEPEVKEKVKKPKKEKVKKEKSKLTKKAKLIIAFSLVGAFLLAGGVFGLIYYLQSIKQLSTPTNLQVYSAGDEIYAKCDRIEKAENYIFEVSYNNENIVLLSSNIPNVELTNYIYNVGDYQIKVKAVGSNPKSASKYESYTYKWVRRLNTPTIYLDSEKQEISFLPVENTNSYKLYYSSLDNTPITITHSGNENVVYNLQNLFNDNGAGYYNIKVIAAAENDNYADSDFSNEVVAIHKTKLEEVSDIQYDSINQIISFTSSHTDFKIILKIQGINQIRSEVIMHEGNEKIVDLKYHNVLKNQEKIIEIGIIAIGTGLTENSDIVVKSITE